MSIHKIGSDLVRPLPARRAGDAEAKPEAKPGQGQAPKGRSDQVGFSAEGLAMAEFSQSERLATIEARIANGFYDDPQIADEVARRIIASGDLGNP